MEMAKMYTQISFLKLKNRGSKGKTVAILLIEWNWSLIISVNEGKDNLRHG